MLAGDRNERGFAIGGKFSNVDDMSSEDVGDLARGHAAAAEPDYLWRMSVDEAEVMKVGVLRDDGQIIVARVLPDYEIGFALES